MTKPITTEKLTAEQIEEKRLELQKQLNTEVVAGCIIDSKGNQIVGYIKHPSFEYKMKALDKSAQSLMGAWLMLLESHLIKEASDPLILDERYENGKVKLSFMTICNRLSGIYEDTLKKK
jgi:hypothetical protein